MKRWKLYHSTISRGPSSSSWVPHSWYTHEFTPRQASGRWWTAVIGSSCGQWWNSSSGAIGWYQTFSAIPSPPKRPGWAELVPVYKHGLGGKAISPSSSSRKLMSSPATLKSGTSCPESHNSDYFFYNFYTNGTSETLFICLLDWNWQR